jgi:hypothetical protein
VKPARMLTAVVLSLAAGSVSAADRKAPSTPRNLRVTATTAHTIWLAWDASRDDSGSVSYRVHQVVSLEEDAGSRTTYTWRSNLHSDQGYAFYVYAVDAAGNRSANSNTVVGRTLPDTTPPQQPVVNITAVGPTWVSLMWSASDDSPFLEYWVYVNGATVLERSTQTSMHVALLNPQTTYAFTVRARDDGVNYSPLSDPVPATTSAPNPDDVTPPTVPAAFSAGSWGDCEVELNWNDSIDDYDPQFAIRYDIYVNGRYDHSTSALYTRAIVYGDFTGVNAFRVVAVDSAGNRSAPAETTDTLTCPQ